LNHPDPAAWRGIFDGLLTPTNSTPEQEILISSNSPQTAIVVAAIDQARDLQPHRLFRKLSDLLAVPELTTASPWINAVAPADLLLSDVDLEAIPAQLLPRLRTDSIGTIIPNDSALEIQFTGYDNYPYVMESSDDLQNWTSVSTNFPADGTFRFTAPVHMSGPAFYRSVLLFP